VDEQNEVEECFARAALAPICAHQASASETHRPTFPLALNHDQQMSDAIQVAFKVAVRPQ
jgi:hypothetical protein